MMQYILKVAISAFVISKRSSLLGGLLASLPLVSFMAMIWLYVDTGDTEKVARLSINIFWLVLPSLMFFILFPLLLRMEVHFVSSFIMATASMLLSYGMVLLVAKKLRLLA